MSEAIPPVGFVNWPLRLYRFVLLVKDATSRLKQVLTASLSKAFDKERKRARLSERVVVSLTCSIPSYNRLGSHRAVMALWGTMAAEVSPSVLAHWRSGA